jgi:hypothetical protein
MASLQNMESRKEKPDILFMTWNQIYPHPTVDPHLDGSFSRLQLQKLSQKYSWLITTRPHLWLKLFNYAYLWSLPAILCLFKSISHVCTLQILNMSWVLTLPLAQHMPSCEINLLSLPSACFFIWNWRVTSWT